MIIGVLSEIKKHEYRVGLTPAGAAEIRQKGHTVLVETGAGSGSGFSDDEYLQADADIVDRKTVFSSADLIVKVKEPLDSEYPLLEDRTAIFAYLHLAPNRELAEHLLRHHITAIGYETLQQDGALPLLAPMSEIAGRMVPLVGAYYLQRIHGGTGVLPTGATGVKPAKAVILGAGVVGANAARICAALGMETVVMNRGIERLQQIREMFQGGVRTLLLAEQNIAEEIRSADLVVGAVLVPGKRPPVLVTRDMLGTMKKGAVVVDVAVDQGGCFETSVPTTHDNPVYEVDGIIHYTVANMPGAYPRTSTIALTTATLPYILMLAEKGIEPAIRDDTALRSGLNTYRGHIVHKGLAESLGMSPVSFDELYQRMDNQ